MNDELSTELIDSIDSIRRSIVTLGLNGANTSLGAIEAHAMAIEKGAALIADSISDLADAIREFTDQPGEQRRSDLP